MDEFGTLLRYYRERCIDSERNKKLSQERLGEFIGRECEDYGVSGAAVSGWENGSRISDRPVFIALIKVLHKCGGLQTLDQANALLKAGDRRALDDDEGRDIFPESRASQSNPPGFDELEKTLTDELIRFIKRIQKLISGGSNEPPPDWPSALLGVLGWPLHRWTSEAATRALAWVIIWFLTWQLTLPLTYWPFAGQAQALQATLMYVGGTLTLPLLIGLLTRTRDYAFWQQQGREQLAKSWVLRLYTYQGAMVGFNLGYMAIFGFLLLLYYISIWPIPALINAIVAIWPVVLGHASARQTPINLMQAFGRLNLRDGGVFFIFVMFGPLWGAFFFTDYLLILSHSVGPMIILLAAFVVAAIMAWQHRKTGTPVIPAYIWAAIFGTMLVLLQILIIGIGFETAVLACIITASVILLAQERIHITLAGGIGFVLVASLLSWILAINLWAGRAAVIGTWLAWWQWGKKYIWFSVGFWVIAIATGICALLIRQGYLTPAYASSALIVFTAIILGLDRRISKSWADG